MNCTSVVSVEEMKLLTITILLCVGIIHARPKSSNSDGAVVLNDIPTSSGTRPRMEQPYHRHALTRSGEGQNCRKPAKCVPIKNNICLTTKLPYSQTSLELVTDSPNDDVQVGLHDCSCVPKINKTIFISGRTNSCFGKT